MTTHCFYSFGTTIRSTKYRHDGREAARSFVLPALRDLGLLPGDGVRYHAFVTEESVRKSGVPLREALGPVAHDACRTWDDPRYRIDRTRDGLWAIVDRILDEVQDGDGVYLEITQGFRHVQIALLLAGGLLVALRPNTVVRGAFYADLGAEDEGAASPVHDLVPLFELFRWAAATDALRTSLDTRPLARLLEDVGRHLGRHAKNDPVAHAELQASRALHRVGPALALGWVHEVGVALAHLREHIEVLGKAEDSALAKAGLISAKHALHGALRILEPLAEAPGSHGLDEHRLSFELRLVRALHQADRHGDALRILREAMVDFQLLADGLQGRWLEHSARRKAEAHLHAAGRSRQAGRLWERVAQARNAASHAGAANAKQRPATLDTILDEAVKGLEALLIKGDWRSEFQYDKAATAFWLVNAFSLNMLADLAGTHANIEPLELDAAQELAKAATSAVGHDGTASRFAELLRREVPTNRVDIALRSGDRLLVGQYRGPRLAVGATTLPDGAEIAWFLVTVTQRPPRA